MVWCRTLHRRDTREPLRNGAQARFRTEAAVAERFQNPGIVAIHDFGEENVVLWLLCRVKTSLM